MNRHLNNSLEERNDQVKKREENRQMDTVEYFARKRTNKKTLVAMIDYYYC